MEGLGHQRRQAKRLPLCFRLVEAYLLVDTAFKQPNRWRNNEVYPRRIDEL